MKKEKAIKATIKNAGVFCPYVKLELPIGLEIEGVRMKVIFDELDKILFLRQQRELTASDAVTLWSKYQHHFNG